MFLKTFPSFEIICTDNEIPRKFKFFTTQFLPVGVFGFICLVYIYFIKIICLWEMPKGIISPLIFGCTTVGVVTYFLSLPYHQDNKAAIYFKRFFFKVMTPLWMLWGYAIYYRVQYYGLTPLRLFSIFSFLFLVVISLSLEFKQKHLLKTFIISMLLFFVGCSFMPFLKASNFYNEVMLTKVLS